jgi:hypothetical protein
MAAHGQWLFDFREANYPRGFRVKQFLPYTERFADGRQETSTATHA